MAESGVRIGVLRGRENSFPDAFIAKVNSMGKGVSAEFVQLGGTKLNEPVPYRVVLDRMSHEVPYYSVYLKMAALQGTYCINNTFWRTADDKFFGYAAAEKLGIAEPKTVVLPNRSYVDDVTAESLRNLWPTDFSMYVDYVGCPCIMKPAFGGGLEGRQQDPLARRADAPLQRVRHADHDAAGVHHLGHLHPRPHHRPALGARHPLRPRPRRAWAATTRTTTSCRAPCGTRPRSCRCRFNVALGYDMNALEFAVKDGQVLRHRPHELHARPRLPQPQGRPLPVGGREDGGVRGREGPLRRRGPRRPPTGRACC